MKTKDFNFKLPDNLIAQHPSQKREESRLLVVNREDDSINHLHFYDIINELDKNSLLVLNNTKVIPARLIGIKEKTNANIEVLLLKEIEKDVWEALVKPAKKIKVGDTVTFGDGKLQLTCINIKEEGIRVFKTIYQGIFLEVLDELGKMPLPPYIKESLKDKDRYQTVYAKIPGSSAAPTAGFHFTNEILKKIKEKGIVIVYITLHVGLGTFRPVQVDNIEEHTMHQEDYYIDEDTANKLNEAIKLKKKIIAVGTTSVRTLESNFNGKINPGFYTTNIFIYPGYKFKVVDSIITNFHLPKSTLLMLISAFYEKNKIIKIYEEAIKLKYRFFSFGDSMFIK